MAQTQASGKCWWQTGRTRWTIGSVSVKVSWPSAYVTKRNITTVTFGVLKTSRPTAPGQTRANMVGSGVHTQPQLLLTTSGSLTDMANGPGVLPTVGPG